MKKEETDTLSLRIPISMKLRLNMIANQENRTINSLVNQILKEYIDNKNVKNREHRFISVLPKFII